MSSLRILGIDPGLSLTGYGLVRLEEPTGEPRVFEAGVLRLKSGAPMAMRLAPLYVDLCGLLEEQEEVTDAMIPVFSILQGSIVELENQVKSQREKHKKQQSANMAL